MVSESSIQNNLSVFSISMTIRNQSQFSTQQRYTFTRYLCYPTSFVFTKQNVQHSKSPWNKNEVLRHFKMSNQRLIWNNFLFSNIIYYFVLHASVALINKYQHLPRSVIKNFFNVVIISLKQISIRNVIPIFVRFNINV